MELYIRIEAGACEIKEINPGKAKDRMIYEAKGYVNPQMAAQIVGQEIAAWTQKVLDAADEKKAAQKKKKGAKK